MLAGGLLATLALGLALNGAEAAERPAKPAAHPALDSLLRLHDLPLGYVFLLPIEGERRDDLRYACSALAPGNPEPKVRAFVNKYSPAGCFTLYVRAYTVPGGTPAPQLAGSAALDTGSVESATAALNVAAEILGHLFDDQALREVAPPQTVGEATRLFHWSPDPLFGFLPDGSLLAWRSGKVAAIVFAAGRTSARADSAALTLALRQQTHIEHPTPYTPAERDDLEVLLDNPRLKFPVLWLGRALSPGHGLGRVRLEEAFADPFASRDDEDTSLYYTRGITVSSWREKRWDPQQDGPKGSRWDCTVSRRIELPDGIALLYASYLKDFASCPHHPRHHFTAVVHSHGMATVIKVDPLASAANARGKYTSLGGLATLARNLQARAVLDY
jgi:hypothetical protein